MTNVMMFVMVRKVSADDGRNFWTLVLDSEAFAGPVFYLLPEVTFRHPASEFRVPRLLTSEF